MCYDGLRSSLCASRSNERSNRIIFASTPFSVLVHLVFRRLRPSSILRTTGARLTSIRQSSRRITECCTVSTTPDKHLLLDIFVSVIGIPGASSIAKHSKPFSPRETTGLVRSQRSMRTLFALSAYSKTLTTVHLGSGESFGVELFSIVFRNPSL